MPSVTMNGSRPRKETSQPLTMPMAPPTTRATISASNTEDPLNTPAQRTAARPSADPTLMSIPPVSTTISSAITTTPMIDICSSRLVRLVRVRNASLESEAMTSRTIRMYRAYWLFSQSITVLVFDGSGCCCAAGTVAVADMCWLLLCRPREIASSVLMGQSRADKVIGVCVLRVELTGDLTVAHDEDAVAQREQFLGLAGHH